MKRDTVLCIAGPTASGKTAVAIEVAKKIPAEIISADSMQVYRHMDIGTAKPTKQEMQGIVHHMMDIIDPDQNFSVAEYQKMASNCISDCLLRGVLPIVVGGSGLYINAITHQLDFFEIPSERRHLLEEEYETQGAIYMYEKMKKLDPASAERIHPNDKKRVIRRIEILENRKGDASAEYAFQKPDESYHYIIVGITKERQKLYGDINKRVDQMRQMGLEREVREIFETYGSESTAFQAIGYKEFLPYFDGKISIEDVYDNIKQNTRRFAKRQFTWFKRDDRMIWFSNDEISCFHQLVDDILDVIKNDIFFVRKQHDNK